MQVLVYLQCSYICMKNSALILCFLVVMSMLDIILCEYIDVVCMRAVHDMICNDMI